MNFTDLMADYCNKEILPFTLCNEKVIFFARPIYFFFKNFERAREESQESQDKIAE